MNVRASGILLHITSLPSRYGIGDLGPSAYAFARLLRELGQLYWQYLPLGPTSPAIGNSPYSSCSAFAGNPLLISPEKLVEDGWLTWADIEGAPHGQPERVDYVAVEQHRKHMLHAAYERNRHILDSNTAFNTFRETSSHWLPDYTRFVTIKDRHGGAVWSQWPEGLRHRHQDAIAQWDAEHADAIKYEAFVQFLFFQQWMDLRRYCNRKGLRLVGDVPIYVTFDSADVWANPNYFKLDENLDPIYVAGVPPDYFSETGQRWGNPVYDWDIMQEEGFSWWINRLGHNFAINDLVRLDHFRGFAGYWEVPAEEETAINGEWVDAPGIALFTKLSRRFTSLPLIAEDLGVITADVRELKQLFNLPGMKILQFGFGGNLLENPDSLFNHERNCVVYTGTHDNAPVREWWIREAGEDGRHNFRQFTQFSSHNGISEDDVPMAFIRLAMTSVANTAIFPMQDILGLGVESRFNTPSIATGNWEWRLAPEMMHKGIYDQFAELTRFFGRWSE